jgi:glyoxylase-like metal-dependent hydrolase (beta-lactamase superfamily II)
VILLDDGVLVVDTHSKPSAARALIAQIKTLTDKPVKCVVNTHFHWDHYQGNQAYVGVWPPGVEIISSEATLAEARKSVDTRLAAKYAGKFPPTFPQDVIGNIEKAYRVVSGATD